MRLAALCALTVESEASPANRWVDAQDAVKRPWVLERARSGRCIVEKAEQLGLRHSLLRGSDDSYETAIS